jgi:nucleoside-diphosphate-sugar epimerase
MAENEVLKFGKKFNVKVLILRLPLIVGKNPLGNLESMIKAIQKGYYFRVGRGDAKRSIISTLQVAISIEKLVGKEGVFNIIDSGYPRINEIDQHIADIYSKKIKTIPRFVFKILSLLGDILPFLPLNSLKYGKLTNSLVFSNLKLLQETNWTPVDSLKDLK